MKILCIGRNYRDHVKEMHAAVPSAPVFFLKPDTALLIRNRPFYLPDFAKEFHYEVELVLRICKVGKNIQKKFAAGYYDAITLGIDFTARDLQDKFKKEGLPWFISKGFDQAAPVGKFVPAGQFPDPENISFRLEKNGTTVQEGNSHDMIYAFDDIISYISHFVTLRTGDLIFTGTPSGVGPVQIGDRLEAFLAGEKVLSCPVR